MKGFNLYMYGIGGLFGHVTGILFTHWFPLPTDDSYMALNGQMVSEEMMFESNDNIHANCPGVGQTNLWCLTGGLFFVFHNHFVHLPNPCKSFP